MRRVWWATGIFALVISLLSFDRYITYHEGADLGSFVQSISTAFHGFYNNVERGSHFTVHFSPVFYLCWPLLKLAPSPVTLSVIQAVACALTAPAVYLFARKRVDERLAIWIAVLVLFYPPLVGVALNEFHEADFAPAAIVLLIWAVDERRWAIASALVLFCLGIKEDESVILGVLGAGYALWSLRRGDRAAALFGGAVAAAAVAVLVSFFTIVRPLAGAVDPWYIMFYYTAHDADVPHGAAVVTGRLTFLLEVFGPLLFLPLRSRLAWLAVPALTTVLVSRWPVTYTMGNHYPGSWIAYVLIAFVAAVAAIAATDPARALNLVRACLVICVLVLVFASPTHWAHYYRLRSAHDAALDRIIARVPADALVGSFDEAYTHMSLNPNAEIGMWLTPDYFVYDERYRGLTWQVSHVPRLEDVVCTGYFVPIAQEDGVTLFKRVKDAPADAYLHAGRPQPDCLHPAFMR